MAFKLKKTGPVTFQFDLTNLKSYQKAYKEFFEKGGIQLTAQYLQKRAWQAMRSKYMQTRANRIYYNKKYLSKPENRKIEFRLFGMEPTRVQRIGNNSYEIRFIEDINRLVKDLPHLLWQEEGTKKKTDRQPYLITKRGLRPITKVKALNIIHKGQDRRGRFKRGNRFNAQIKYITVEHPALKARGFIKDAQSLLKSKGEKIAGDFIRQELRRLRGK